MDTTTTKDKLARFGRSFALLLNRGLMYQKSHPMVKESINEVHRIAELLLVKISPLVFILNRDQFYIDEEQIDPRINIKRIATLFKNHKIQSVSFENGLTQSELDIFIDLFASMTMTTDAEHLTKALFARGAFNIKINHVLYKKVTSDDQIISREALKEVAPAMEAEDSQSRKKFMDTLLETILTEEFANTLNIKSLLANPRLVSQNMIKADLAGAQKLANGQSRGRTRIGTGTLAMEEPEERMGAEGSGTGKGLGPGTGEQGGPGQGAGFGAPTAGSGDGMGQGGLNIGAGTGSGSGGGTGLSRPGDGTGAGGSEFGVGTGTGSGGSGAGMGPAGLGDGTGTAGMGPGAGGRGGLSEPAERTGEDRTGTGMGAMVGLSATMASPETGLHAGVPSGQPEADVHIHRGVASGQGTDQAFDSDIGQTAGAGDESGGHGPMLLRQLEIIQEEVQKQLQGEGEVSLEDLADAVFEMKRQFFEDLQTQKTLGIAYANEEAIVRNINQLTDQVILKLIQEEYTAGKITTQRLAQIILRLIPEPQELRRLLPQIKTALTQVGMLPEEYLELIDKLKKELQNEDLTRILEESSEAIGVDSSELIDELKKNPDQAAKLIYLASEIGKGAGDESALADILVDYVEKMTVEAAAKADEGGDDDAHLKKVVSQVESTLFKQLGKYNVGDDVLGRMENRINERMDSILDKMRVEWLNAQAGISRKEKQIRLSVLQTLEHSVGEDDELSAILKVVRAKVEAGEIEENNYSQIDAEITEQRKRLEKEAAALEIPEGVLNSDELMFILEKEIARANRYNAPFSALAFSFVSAKPKMKALKDMVSVEAIMMAALEQLVGTIREVDYIGQIGKNKMVALLPMIAYPAAKSALVRVMNLMHSKPLKVHEVPVDLRVAGVVAQFNAEQTPNAQAFAKHLTNQLMDMVARIKNIQVLF